MKRSRRGTPAQVDRRGDGEQGGRHHDQDEVLDHVVPEKLLVIDADEAKDGDCGSRQPADEGRRLEGGPGVTGLEPVNPLHSPEVEGQGAQDHDHGDGVERGGKELAPPQWGQ